MADGKNNRLSGIHPLSYLGVNASQPSNTVEYDRAPTSNDRRNFKIGARWIDKSQSPPDLWTLVKFAGNTATWINLSSFNTNGTDGQVLIGGGTAATWNNITTISGLVVVNEGANTLDLDLSGTVADIFQTDVLFAQPSGGVLEIAGGTSVTTTGSGNVVTIDVDADVATTFAGDAGTATPAANVLTIAGGANVTTNAAGSTVTITASGGGGGGAANASFLAHQVANGGAPNGGIYLGASIIMTEVYDVGADFFVGDGGGTSATFTAPQDGKYLLTMSVKFTTSATLATVDRLLEIETSNRTYRSTNNDVATGATIADHSTISFSVVADMDASDTAEYFMDDTDALSTLQGDVAGTGEYQTFVSGALQETDNMSFTEHAVLVGGATGDIDELALATDGQVLIGATGAASAWANITAGANITINEGANSLEIVSTGGGLGSAVSSFSAFQPSSGGDTTALPGIYLGAAVQMTEIFDVGGDFTPGDGAGTPAQFVAPQAGKYQVSSSAWLLPHFAKVTSTTHYLYLITSNREYWFHTSIEIQAGSTARYPDTPIVSLLVDMDMGDTLEVLLKTTGGTADCIVQGDLTRVFTSISGTLV